MIQLDPSTAIALVGVIAALLWLIIRLALRPIEQTLQRWESTLAQVKSETDLANIIDVRINHHKETCHRARAHDKPTAAGIVAAVLIALLLAILSCSCATNPMVPPAQAFVDTVGMEYIEYVEADPKLNEDARRARRANVEAFKMLIKEAQK